MPCRVIPGMSPRLFYKGKVSVSGGGDSLYKYKEHEDWWNRLFEITDRLNMFVDVHTREKFVDREFWVKINRCVFSSWRRFVRNVVESGTPFL